MNQLLGHTAGAEIAWTKMATQFDRLNLMFERGGNFGLRTRQPPHTAAPLATKPSEAIARSVREISRSVAQGFTGEAIVTTTLGQSCMVRRPRQD
ncbi:MAG: hypothetical protein ABIN44_06800 [Burkholderiaceae bacterium]